MRPMPACITLCRLGGQIRNCHLHPHNSRDGLCTALLGSVHGLSWQRPYPATQLVSLGLLLVVQLLSRGFLQFLPGADAGLESIDLLTTLEVSVGLFLDCAM